MTDRDGRRGGWYRLRAVSWVLPVALFGLWLMLSGKLHVFHVSVGAATVLLAVWLSARMAPLEDVARPRLRLLATLAYTAWLFWQMIASAIYVLRVILNPRGLLDPRMVELSSPQPSLLCRVIVANSITLTPGTLTCDIEGDVFVVHALCKKTADDLMTGDMARRVAGLSKGWVPVPAPADGAEAGREASE